MNRRGFLTAMLAAGVAPAIVRASSLMPVRQRVLTFPDYPIIPRWINETELYGASPALRSLTASEVLYRKEHFNLLMRDITDRFIEQLINPPITHAGKVITLDRLPAAFWKNAR